MPPFNPAPDSASNQDPHVKVESEKFEIASFDPSEYKSIEDMPKEARGYFMPIPKHEGGGFKPNTKYLVEKSLHLEIESEEILNSRWNDLENTISNQIKNKIKSDLPFTVDTESSRFGYYFREIFNDNIYNSIGEREPSEEYDSLKNSIEILEKAENNLDSVIDYLFSIIKSYYFRDKTEELLIRFLDDVTKSLEIENGKEYDTNHYFAKAKVEHFLKQSFPELGLGSVRGFFDRSDIYRNQPQDFMKVFYEPVVNTLGNQEKTDEMAKSILSAKPTAEEVFTHSPTVHGRIAGIFVGKNIYHSEDLGLSFNPMFYINNENRGGPFLQQVFLSVYSEDKGQLEKMKIILKGIDQTKKSHEQKHSFAIENVDEVAGKLGVLAEDLNKVALGFIEEKYSISDLSELLKIPRGGRSEYF